MGRNRTGLAAGGATLMASLAMAMSTTAALAQTTNPYGGKSTQEEQFLDYGPGTGKPKSIFDAKNPGDLINTLRKGAAMDDATPPGMRWIRPSGRWRRRIPRRRLLGRS